MKDIFDSFYKTDRDQKVFGDNWCGADKLEHNEDALIAKYTSGDDSDGCDVEVYGCSMPAMFYTIVALGGKNSVGEEVKGFTMSTGSGMAEMSHKLAMAIAEGMIGLD